MDTASRLESEGTAAALEEAARRVFTLPLTTAGYRPGPFGGWVWQGPDAFAALAVRAVDQVETAGVRRPGGVAITFGWRFDRFGDPHPSPASAEGCVRQLSLDDLVPAGGSRIAALPTADGVAQWEQRLATAVRKHLAGWWETWKRPDGFRDFLAAHRFHLAAGWLSALLGQPERADLELRSSAALLSVDLDRGFDRRRADLDESLAAPIAARHGLAAFLADAERAGDRASLESFGGDRAGLAKDRVTDPAREHARLRRRAEIYAALCLEHVGERG